MDRKKVRILVLLAVAALTFGFVFQTALANVPVPPGNWCGKSGPFYGEDGLVVKKDVYCAMERAWSWLIEKTADQSSLTLSPGQTFLVNYSVKVSATASESNYSVNGAIGIGKNYGSTATIKSVTDSLGPVTSCTMGGIVPVMLPYTFPSIPWVFECTYEASLGSPVSENVATVVYSLPGGVDQSIDATSPIDWSLAATTETDECIEVTDTFAGPLGTVCAGGAPKTFTYSRLIGPYDVCGDYTVSNIASFITNDSGATGSSSKDVNIHVPCAGGCTLTPGYWKTHSMYGPAPYDDTWAQIGEDTPFFFSGKSYYQVLWTPPQGNAYYILAHAYIAAKLNFLNGAASTPEVDAAIAWAESFFGTYAPTSTLSREVRNQAISYASLIDQYNNGYIGPGHCSE